MTPPTRDALTRDTPARDALTQDALTQDALTQDALTRDALALLTDLLRIDTSNPGDGSGPGERRAAEYVAEKLCDAGLEPVYLESERLRGNVVVRLPGRDPDLPALLVHGHLDVVPADASEWTLPPFAGEHRDGAVWGRGAVDMKDMDAMMLALARSWAATGRRPRRDLVFAWMADEEAGSTLGSRYLVEHHRDLFDGCAEAISEVGGFSVDTGAEHRLYLIETAQKGLHWLRLTTEGRPGHGSMLHADSAVAELAGAVARIAAHRWPLVLTPTTRHFLAEAADAFGVPFDPDRPDPSQVLDCLGPLAGFIGASFHHTANPTRLTAGYKTNVVPGSATAEIDGRFLPGLEDQFLRSLTELAGPKVRWETIERDAAVSSPFEAPLVSAMAEALLGHDPRARTVPYCLSAGTDNMSFASAGITGYGFVPRQLPPDLDFAALFHGVDERVPESSVAFGLRVLDDLLTRY
ncbi:M20/M25/M40 family metallo-hydrolase [Streptomyces spongiicola]|uniref:M20/M25/M40 family metallo-hydrolase n=1 Tax=Streptomyces spongiicola TaxID=1690221 RepID=UPI0033C7ACAF